MNFETFHRRAEQIFAEIPPEFREGVDGLAVEREAMPHPELPDIYTLGECRSEYYPSEFGGAGEVRSLVYLYHGSFAELARLSDEWDWEGELWETITHEVRHHLESLASDDALEEMDYAHDNNFARREGEAFDPFFYRSGERIGPDVYDVDGDRFIERHVDLRGGRVGELSVELDDERFRFAVPDPLGDVHLLTLVAGAEPVAPGAEEPDAAEVLERGGEVVVVLIRKRGVLGWMRDLLRRAALDVRQSEAVAEPVR